MLVLSRKEGEQIVLDGDIVVEVIHIKKNRVRLGIEAPLAKPILRQEIVMNQHCILIAEDDDEMRALLTWRLEKDGFRVAECHHGIDLINRIDPIGSPEQREMFDLIISDVRMPGITGLEVLEDVRHCGTECPPVILVTAFGDKETHRQAQQLGAAAMFDKPFDVSDLLAKVHELLPSPPSVR